MRKDDENIGSVRNGEKSVLFGHISDEQIFNKEEIFIVYETKNEIDEKIYIGVHRIQSFEFDGYFGSGKLLKRAIGKHGPENFTRRTLAVFGNPEEAFEYENKIVDEEFVRRDDTYNMCVGGYGGDRLSLLDEESQDLRRARFLGSKLGKEKDDAETKAKKSLAAKRRIKDHPHTLPNNRGRVHSPKAREAFIETGKRLRGKCKTITDGKHERKHPIDEPLPEGWNYGRKPSPRFQKHTEESKRKIADSVSGVVCYNDGITNMKVSDGQIPLPFFKPGMIQKHDKMWITDGTCSKFIKKRSAVPEGWRRGRTIERRSK